MARVPRSTGLPLLVLAVLALGLGACTAGRTVQHRQSELTRATGEVPDAQRLDIGIVVFDPGLGDNPEGNEDKMIFPEVRQAEARYMPYQLKNTLESSGHWGSVWVVPERSDAVDLTVWGRIDRSNGLEATVRIGAWDATGRQWLNKTYDITVPEKAYSKYREQGQDPYQTLYNDIANDLLKYRDDLSEKELATVRNVAGLRYGADLVPAAFADLLEQDRSGNYKLRRLPAVDDPMVARMEAVREREYVLYDTLNEYYANLYYQLGPPYEDWRKMSREEVIKYQDLRRSAFIRGAAGALAILAAVLYESNSGSNDAITMAGVFGGIEGIKSGIGKASEAGISRESLKELGVSFNAEAEPMVVEVEGQTRRLTGTAEERYKEWRALLREIYSREAGTGAAEDAAAAGMAGAPPADAAPAAP